MGPDEELEILDESATFTKEDLDIIEESLQEDWDGVEYEPDEEPISDDNWACGTLDVET